MSLLSAFGLGAVVTAAVQAWLTQRAALTARNIGEKKEAYLGLLQAIHNSETAGTEETARLVGHWVDRCELVGSRDVASASRRLFDTNPIDGQTHPNRPDTLRDLKRAMRRDLGVA